MPERNRFLRGMIPWVGYRQTGIEYERVARFAGESKFSSVSQMLPFAVDAVTSFSYFPLQIATYLGFIIAVISGLAILSVVLLRLFGPDTPASRPGHNTGRGPLPGRRAIDLAWALSANIWAASTMKSKDGRYTWSIKNGNYRTTCKKNQSTKRWTENNRRNRRNL